MSGASSGPDAMRRAVRGWLERMRHSPNADYRAYQEKIADQSCRDIAAFHNGTTPGQRAQATRRLAGYARDFRDLGD